MAECYVSDMIDEDDIAEQVTEAANAMYELNIPKLATVYIQESDGELVLCRDFTRNIRN